MFVVGVIYIIVYYMTGLKYGFYRNSYALENGRMIKYVIPIIAIIISIEFIRRVILAQNLKFANVLVFVSSIIVDLIIFINYNRMNTFNSFIEIFAMVSFPAITSNVLYTFISKKYGMWPNVLYRLVTTLYLYFIISIPKTADIMISFVKLFLPILILLFINILYKKQKRFVNHKKKIVTFTLSTLGIVIMASIVMLI